MAKSSEPVPVLIVDADPAHRQRIEGQLREAPAFRASVFASTAAADRAPAAAAAHILVADIDSIGGPARLRALARRGRAVIATGARGSVGAAIEAIRAGATDYLPKPFGARALVERLDAAVAAWRHAPAGESALPDANAPAATDFAGFIGKTTVMEALYERIDRVAASRAPVFITGESGAGKEVCAEAIHAQGGADRPFVAVNCSALPHDLVESEMFGHVRGAFTGATADRAGAAELADGGTLFLDEICEMPAGLQAKLLRFVQTGILHRVGDARDRKVDVRIVCATNRNPDEEVRAGRFRADLFYRLNVLPVRLPALRERRRDIVLLADTFLARFGREEGRPAATFPAAAAALLAAHDWPGNVRQLQNLVRRLVVLQDGGAPTPAAVAAALAEMDPPTGPAAPAGPGTASAIQPFHQQERRIIEEALAAFDGNIARAAAALQLNPSTLYRKRQAWLGLAGTEAAGMPRP